MMRVSVVIPTFRRGKSLARTLGALTAQALPAHEIIVVDQNEAGWLENEVGADLSAAIVHWTPQPNASAARNFGFVRSSGDLVLFIDDDLIPEPDFLSEGVSRLCANPEVGCLAPLVVTDETNVAEAARHARSQALREHPMARGVLAMPSVISAAMFFRRETYEKSGGFDELLFDFARAGEDQELCFRMRARGLDVWLDTSLAVFHDETTPGGCELRTQPYWQSRERAIRSNVLRARLHARGRIQPGPMIRLVRSAFLNSAMARNPPLWTLRNARLLARALVDSKSMLQELAMEVEDYRVVDHLRRHHEDLGVCRQSQASGPPAAPP